MKLTTRDFWILWAIITLLAIIECRGQMSLRSGPFVAVATRPAAAGYTPNAVKFLSDYMERTTDFTDLADGKAFTFSFWIKPNGSNNLQTLIFEVVGSGLTVFGLEKWTDNTIILFARNPATSTILLLTGSTAITDSSGWKHVCGCIDLSDTGKRFMYVNGVAETLNVTTYVNDVIDFAGSKSYYFGTQHGTTKTLFLHGSVADFWFNDSYFDLSDSGNRAKFYNGGPVNLGSNGETPTGSSPVLFLKNPYNTFTVNSGTGGDWTSVTGTLETDTFAP